MSTPASQRLIDQYGRIAKDLRVSLTDRCNLRCVYCMPAEGLSWTPTENMLSDAEIIRLIRIAVQKLGISQIRFTGGEPLLRKNLEYIIAEAAQLVDTQGFPISIALTTNGLGLDKRIYALKEAGLNRVNISLDSLNPSHYHTLTRRNRIESVLRSIEAVLAADLKPVKINAVIMRGINEQDIVPLTLYSLAHGLQLRFIEQMPLGPQGQWHRENMITAKEIIDCLSKAFELTSVEEPRGTAPAALWNAVYKKNPSLSGKVGIIASVTQPFCGACDRTRLTSDGNVRNCLFANSETSLRNPLRAGKSDEEIAEIWANAQWGKKLGHSITEETFQQPKRPMSAIGG